MDTLARLLKSLFCCFLAISSFTLHCRGDSPLPRTWFEAYERLNRFSEAKEKHWPSSHLSIQADGAVHCLLPNDGEFVRLGIDIVKYESSGGGWMLSRVLNAPNPSLNDRTIQFEPGIYAGMVSSTVELVSRYHAPIVWFEVSIPDKLATSRNSKSARVFNEISPPKEPSLLWPNQRIVDFIDLAGLFDRRAPMELSKENKVVSPSATLRIRNDGVLERELFSDPKFETALRLYIYRYNELVVNRPAAGQTRFTLKNEGYGSYRAFLCVEGPQGAMPVSNLLNFPLFPDGEGQIHCIPDDRNQNKIPDFFEGSDMPPREYQELTVLWKRWWYSLNRNLNRDSVDGMWLIVHPALQDRSE